VLALCGLGEVEQVAGEAEHARRYYMEALTRCTLRVGSPYRARRA
jgi:hypothetical protein